MKLGPDALVEIVSIIQNGLLRQSDVSGELREIDLESFDGMNLNLSEDYLMRKGRRSKKE